MSPEPQRSLSLKIKEFLISNRVYLFTILGVILGLICGLLVKSLFWPNERMDPYLLRYISLPGILYVRLFLVLIVPLLISSLSTSFIHMEEKQGPTSSQDIGAKKLLLISMAFFVSFTTIAAVTGISLVAILKPGTSVDITKQIANANNFNPIELRKIQIEQLNYRTDSVYNLLLNIVPDNCWSILFMTPYTKTDTIWPANMAQILEPNFKPTLKQRTIQGYRPNMLGICAISFLLGLLLKSIGEEKSRHIRGFLKEINMLVGESFRLLMGFMPFGMFMWMFSEGLKMNSISGIALQLAYFFFLVAVGFCFLWLVFYPTIYFIFTRQSAFRLYKDMVPAMLIAIGSTSSAITLPMTMKCMQEKAKLPKEIANTILPLGMTIHMNGAALYMPMVALFIAQIKQLEMDFFMLVVLCLFVIAMTMGLPASPSSGGTIVTHLAFLSFIGIENPLDVLAFIMPFEWIFERARTSTNVMGDCIVAKCVEKVTQALNPKDESPDTVADV